MVMLIVFTSSKNNDVEFKHMKLNLMINDEDKSEESKALINYLKEKHNVKEEKITESEAPRRRARGGPRAARLGCSFELISSSKLIKILNKIC